MNKIYPYVLDWVKTLFGLQKTCFICDVINSKIEFVEISTDPDVEYWLCEEHGGLEGEEYDSG